MVAKMRRKCYHCCLKVKSAVEVVLPIKQGLKPEEGDILYVTESVEVVLPIKQGLKLHRL